MKDQGILFSAPMVRAILDGTKTQTRRAVKSPAKNMQANGMDVIKPRDQPPGWSMRNKRGVWEFYTHKDFLTLCQYGKPGERMWVRETWRPCMEAWDTYVEFAAGGDPLPANRDLYAGLKKIALRFHGARRDVRSEAWHPSILMPRWASRITLEITDVRVERLHSISDADIRAEGVTAEAVEALIDREWVDGFGIARPTPIADLSPRDLWRVGWSAINGAESWDANPWLWCLTFRRMES